MKKIIINKKQRLLILGDIKLLPGANEVESHLVDKKENLAMLVEKAESGCIEMPKAEIEDDLADDILGQYNAGDAIALVRETNDYDTLMRYQTEEMAGKKRSTVLKAIEAQIALSKEALTGNE